MNGSSAAVLLASLVLTAPASAADKKDQAKASLGPKGMLVKAVASADRNRDGELSIEEFERVPVLRDAPTGKIDELFVTLDGNANGALSPDEVTKGLSKIGDLVKAAASSRNDGDSRRRLKKLKRALGR